MTSKGEIEHGLQDSAAKVRIDQQVKPTPPAVGEFAVLELARVRARLAKYEDAEGRPKKAKWEYCPECGSEQVHHEEGDHKQCADCYQEWFADMEYSDVVRVHLGGKYRNKDAVIDRLNAELAALKAQPCGVVGGVVATAPARIFLIIGAECPRDAQFSDLSEVSWCEDDLDNGIEYVRADLVGLNSSPVSAGDECGCYYGPAPHECFYKIPGAVIGESKPLPKSQWPSNFSEDADCPGMGTYLCKKCETNVSAGGVDERAAHVPDDVFEKEFLAWWESDGQFCRAGGGNYERTFAFEAWRHLYPMLMQARATLTASAPSHGEQVRDGWKLVPVEPTPEMLASVTTSKHEALRAEVMRMAATDYRLMLAAAPSAASQKDEV